MSPDFQAASQGAQKKAERTQKHIKREWDGALTLRLPIFTVTVKKRRKRDWKGTILRRERVRAMRCEAEWKRFAR